ncbi:MAG: pentapeptide repeat-containing protein [Verrucomicrobia bacterium]|nr:pentapeptide repeat-containing protein [Verrucomicrobiota bacterium]
MKSGLLQLRRKVFAAPVDFREVVFAKGADFGAALFPGKCEFCSCSKVAFDQTRDSSTVECVTFARSRFNERVSFKGAVFSGSADFTEVSFVGGADFRDTSFAGPFVNFRQSYFAGRTEFAPRLAEEHSNPLFADAEVDFREVALEPLDAVSFRSADLQKCRFLCTDVRKIGFHNVLWPEGRNRSARKWEPAVGWVLKRLFKKHTRTSSRLAVWDWVVWEQSGAVEQAPFDHLERLFRELKQNFEERRAWEEARHFHYMEKNMRRQNPKTPFPTWFLLRLYWWFGGFGERCTRPLLYALILLMISTIIYACCGLAIESKSAGVEYHVIVQQQARAVAFQSQAAGRGLRQRSRSGPAHGKRVVVPSSPLPTTKTASVSDTLLYSLRTMTLLRSDGFVFTRWDSFARWWNTFESLLGPILLGLFALAVRQQMKR